MNLPAAKQRAANEKSRHSRRPRDWEWGLDIAHSTPSARGNQTQTAPPAPLSHPQCRQRQAASARASSRHTKRRHRTLRARLSASSCPHQFQPVAQARDKFDRRFVIVVALAEPQKRQLKVRHVVQQRDRAFQRGGLGAH
jgi:hypothetical protein